MNNNFNEDEVFEKRTSRKKTGTKNILKNKKVILLIAIVIILIIAKILISGIINLIVPQKGNTVGNISNSGYSAEKGNYIFYVAPSSDMNSTNIHKVKKGSSESETIYNGKYDICSLNIHDNKLYFISISYDDVTDEDGVDNKIYKMNLDGSNPTVINDNEFAYDYSDMYIIKNKIYYVGEDHNVYKMNLNGKKRELVAETGTGFLAINEKYILYNKENEEGNDYITYIKSLSKNDEKPVNGSRLYTPDIQGKDIYYFNEEQKIKKINIKTGKEETVYDGSAYNLNIYKDNIYYLAYKDEANEDYTICLHKLNIKDGKTQLMKEFTYYSSFINIVNDYIYYMDMDNDKAFINLLNVNDPSNEIKLYEWSYGSGM